MQDEDLNRLEHDLQSTPFPGPSPDLLCRIEIDLDHTLTWSDRTLLTLIGLALISVLFIGLTTFSHWMRPDTSETQAGLRDWVQKAENWRELGLFSGQR